jgi:hypothetical protein
MQKFYQELFIIPPKQLDNWISRPLQFYDMPVRGVRKDDTVVFDNAFTFNLKTRAFAGSQGQMPVSVFVRQGNDLVEFPSQNPTVPVSVFILDNNDNYAAIALDRDLAKSLFVRLYFMNGFGLQHFKRFIDAADGNNYIGVYKIEW